LKPQLSFELKAIYLPLHVVVEEVRGLWWRGR
jgi:hypothetical protein